MRVALAASSCRYQPSLFLWRWLPTWPSSTYLLQRLQYCHCSPSIVLISMKGS